MKFDIKNENLHGENTAKRYRIELTMTGLVGAGTVLALGLVWVFIFGVLVGRGYQPDTVIPEVAKVLPGETETAAGTPTGEKVIEPEDLAFYDRLKQSSTPQERSMVARPVAEKPAGNVVTAAITPQTTRGPEASKAVPAQVEEVVLEQPAVQMAAATPPALPAAAPAATKPTEIPTSTQQTAASVPNSQDLSGEDVSDQTRYDYVYQVASLSEPQAALRFRDQIRGLGLGAEVRVTRGSDKVWHRVVVLFQGRPIDTREMKAKLQAIGVDKPLLRSKTPVGG